jgi:putative membrane protein
MAWNRTGITLMAFGFVLERFGLFLHMLRGDPAHVGRDLSFWIGCFHHLGLWVIGFHAVSARAENPEAGRNSRATAWAGMAMNLSVVILGFALLAYLFYEL